MKKRTIVVGALGTLGFLAVVGCILLSHWMNSGANGTVHVGQPVGAVARDLQPVSITTPFFTTELPAGFSEKRRTTNSDPTGTLLQLFATGGPNRQQDIAITIGTLPAGGLSDVADYNLRTSQPSQYQAFTPPGLPSGAIAFRSTGSTPSIVIFWPETSRYREIAFSGAPGSTLEALQATYLHVIASWKSP